MEGPSFSNVAHLISTILLLLAGAKECLGSIPCDADTGLIRFLGPLMGCCVEKGSLALSWDPAWFFSFDLNNTLACDEPVYDVFVADSGFSFEPYSVPALRDRTDLIHVRTGELDVLIHNLEPGADYSVLVTAGSQDRIYSTNRESINITVSSVDTKLSDNVKRFAGEFVATRSLRITYNRVSGLLFLNGSLPAGMQDVRAHDHLNVLTTFKEAYIFKVVSVVSRSETGATFVVLEQSLVDLFEQLSVDLSVDPVQMEVKEDQRLIGTRTVWDRTLVIDRILSFGPLTVATNSTLSAFIRYRVSIGRPRLRRGTVAVASMGGTVESAIAVTYEGPSTHSVSLSQSIWHGTPVLVTFHIVFIPVWITIQPKVDLRGSVDVNITDDVELSVSQNGSFSFTAGYDNGWQADVNSSFASTPIETDFEGGVSGNVEAGAVVTMCTSFIGLVGVDLGVSGGVQLRVDVETVDNTVLLSADTPFEFTRFDVDGFVEGTVVGTSIFGDKDFGNLFQTDLPLFRLPAVEQINISLAQCTESGNALELTVFASETESQALFSNRIVPGHVWLHDTIDAVGQSDAVASSYLLENADTRTVTLKMPRTAVGNIGGEDYGIPGGMLWFRTTPFILQRIPYTVIANANVEELFGNRNFQCCADADCDVRYPNESKACLDDLTCGHCNGANCRGREGRNAIPPNDPSTAAGECSSLPLRNIWCWKCESLMGRYMRDSHLSNCLETCKSDNENLRVVQSKCNNVCRQDTVQDACASSGFCRYLDYEVPSVPPCFNAAGSWCERCKSFMEPLLGDVDCELACKFANQHTRTVRQKCEKMCRKATALEACRAGRFCGA